MFGGVRVGVGILVGVGEIDAEITPKLTVELGPSVTERGFVVVVLYPVGTTRVTV